jgi:hypothetical protein
MKYLLHTTTGLPRPTYELTQSEFTNLHRGLFPHGVKGKDGTVSPGSTSQFLTVEYTEVTIGQRDASKAASVVLNSANIAAIEELP